MIPAAAQPVRIAMVVCGAVLSVAFFVGMATRSADIPVWLVSTLYRVGSAWIFILLYLTGIK